MAGRSDPSAAERLVSKVSAMTGLDPQFVRRAGGRLETQSVLREVFRSSGKLGSRYDINVTALRPLPLRSRPAARTTRSSTRSSPPPSPPWSIG